jgi:Ser/Thr protein kinase RdoA (MazF antagonist)
VQADLDAEPPVVAMSRLPGTALGTRPLGAGEIAAVAASIGRLHRAIPRRVLGAVEPMPFGPMTAVARVRAMARETGVPEDPAARCAWRRASAWLERGEVERAAAGDRIAVYGRTTVFGHGDANLANYLHDGHTVRLVDFEDSGRSERAWELAIFTEHLSVHGDGGVPAEVALGYFETGTTERVGIRAYRRLLATFWLMMLLPGGPSHRRNPPGTLQRQASRLLELLG